MSDGPEDLEPVADKRFEGRTLANPGIHSEMSCPLLLEGRTPRGFEGRPFEFGMFWYRLIYGLGRRPVSTFRTINEKQRLVYLYEEQMLQGHIYHTSEDQDAQSAVHAIANSLGVKELKAFRGAANNWFTSPCDMGDYYDSLSGEYSIRNLVRKAWRPAYGRALETHAEEMSWNGDRRD